MIRALLSAASLALACAAPLTAQTAPPTIEELLARSPVILQADAERRAAMFEARQLEAGAYETQIGTDLTRRSTDLEGDFSEWSLGVSRRVRWPEKRQLDEALARNTRLRADTRFEQVWRDEAQDWARLWTEFALAQDQARLARARTQGAQDRLDAEHTRVRQGRGRAIDLDRLGRDLALADVAQAEADMQARLARLALEARFTGASALAEPVAALLASCARTEALPVAPAVRFARLERERLDLESRRAQIDLLPDPQLGLNAFSERDGEETGLGVSFSVPIAGDFRRARRDGFAELELAAASAQRAAEAEAERQRVATELRAVDSLRRRDQARLAEAAASSVVERLERGAELQAVTMLEILEARRSLWMAQLVSAEARATFDHARLRRAILSGCIQPQ